MTRSEKTSEHLLPNWDKNAERGALIIGHPGHTLGKWPGYESIQVPKSPTSAIEQTEDKNPKEGKNWCESPGTRIYSDSRNQIGGTRTTQLFICSLARAEWTRILF